MSVAQATHELAPWFEIVIEPDREQVHIKPIGELDLAAAPKLREAVSELIDVGFDQLVIDLRGLVFIDVCGARLLHDLNQNAAGNDCRLTLIQGAPKIHRVFQLTGALGSLPVAKN